jgi:hypothetical protein
VSAGRDIRGDLEPGTPEELIRLAERLERERPVPSAGFRGAVRRQLTSTGQGSRPRPARLRALIAGYAAAGCLLLLLGAVSAAGIGPLGA